MEEVKDNTMPEGKWQFDEAVTDAFEDMLRRSIPLYEAMRKACFSIGTRFVQRSTTILDIGCSRGDALRPFIDKFGVSNRYIGLEISPPMLEAARQQFAGLIKTGFVDIREHDLRQPIPNFGASLTLCVLTLQFTPIEYRQAILRNIFKITKPGGVLILVEKVLGANAELDAIFVEDYYTTKREAGYSEDQIQRKRHSLEGVLVPATAGWNEDLLRQAGFRSIDCFWRFLNFAAWVAVKEGDE